MEVELVYLLESKLIPKSLHNFIGCLYVLSAVENDGCYAEDLGRAFFQLESRIA